jgi:hypothetical protein
MLGRSAAELDARHASRGGIAASSTASTRARAALVQVSVRPTRKIDEFRVRLKRET